MTSPRLGTDIVDELAPRDGELVLSKEAASAFSSTTPVRHLVEWGVDTIIHAGCVTSGCVRHPSPFVLLAPRISVACGLAISISVLAFTLPGDGSATTSIRVCDAEFEPRYAAGKLLTDTVEYNCRHTMPPVDRTID